MNITQSNWMQVEKYHQNDDRAVVPLGCVEQHAYLSLSTDSLLAERLAQEAATPLGIPVFPVLPYGVTPHLTAYPGTVSIRLETYLNIIRDILDSLAGVGFKRILFVNGHGGNSAAMAGIQEWVAAHNAVKVKIHDWWAAPKVWQKVMEIDEAAAHASWMENFPWTRLEGVEMPASQKPIIDWRTVDMLHPDTVREHLGDGSYGGVYQKPDEVMAELWEIAVTETRAILENEWL